MPLNTQKKDYWIENSWKTLSKVWTISKDFCDHISSREPRLLSCTGSCKSWNTTEVQWTYKDGWQDFSLLQTDLLSLGWIWFLTWTSPVLKRLQWLLNDELLMKNNNRILQVFDNVKTKRLCETSIKKMEVERNCNSLLPMRWAIFPLRVSKVLRLPQKCEDRSYEVLHLSRKITVANLKIWCSKMQSISRNQRPDLVTSLMEMCLVLRLPCEMHLLCRWSSNVPRLPWFL